MADSVINTFDKGLNQDTSYLLQPYGTYRNMKNGMLISYDGNHYTVEMAKGNKVLLTLRPRYAQLNNNTATLEDTIPMPIGFGSFIDNLVVFSTSDEGVGGYGEIGLVKFTKVNDDFVGVYTPYYNHEDLKFTKVHRIEGFPFKENNNIERYYWTDDYNEPRVFDFKNPIFTTYIASGSLVAGKKYMVLNGVILHNGLWYGPTTPLSVPAAPNYINGNIFTAVNTVYGTVSGGPLIIEYYPIALLDWTPTRLLGGITFKSYGTGNKYCGNNIYFYRLSSSTEGYSTSWSYASSPIHIGMNNIITALTGNPYKDFVGNGTDSTLINSNKSIILTIDNIDTNFDTIELACAEYDQIKDVPTSLTIVVKKIITGVSMDLEDVGQVNLGVVTISDLTSFPASVLKVKTMTTSKNYEVIANLTEREEFVLDLTGVSTTAFQYPMLAHGDYINTCANGNIPIDQNPILGVNPASGSIKPYTRWLVTFGNLSTDTVLYNGNLYATGDVIIGIVGFITISFTGISTVRPCTTRNRYTAFTDGKRREDAIELNTGFWDYKDPAVASHNLGYWKNERYRDAVIFWDKKGNPYYAKWLSDIDIPTISTSGGLIKKSAFAGGTTYALNATGLNISGLDIPESIMNNISGFSIVRAQRDVRIVAQGLLNQNAIKSPGGGTNDFIFPIGTTVPSLTSSATGVIGISPDYFSYLCPDYNMGIDFNGNFSQVGVSMEEACFIKKDSGFKTEGDHHNVYDKTFDTLTSDAQFPRKWKLKSINGLGIRAYNEAATDILFDGAYDYHNYDQNVSGSSLNASIVGGCSTNGSFVAPTVLSTGGKKLIIKPDVQINYYNVFTNYGSSSAGDNKLLANIVNPITPANQYGGQSDTSKANTLYMSTGHFQPINSTVKTETLNGTFTTGQYSGQNKYTFNNVEIFGGDCFLCLVDFGLSLWDSTYNIPTSFDAMSFATTFPCECNSNYNLRRGLKISNKDMYPSGLIGWNTPLIPSTQLEAFSYNKSYSTEGNIIKYPALPFQYKSNGVFQYRMRYAGEKIPGELNNTFRTFKIGNYIDIDGQRGQINDVRSRDSKLFYWQDHSVGYAPITERQLIAGDMAGSATALGVTGVLDRYEDIDTYFGNQHQFGLVETEYGFAWFDMRRRAFMVMGIGSKPEEVSLVKGLQVYFNNEFNEGNIPFPNTYSTVYNTNNLNIPEAPLLGYGIIGVYDPRFKMTYLTFKYNNESQDFSKEDFNESKINKDFTIGYNHILNAFVSFYDYCPAIWHNHNDLILSSNNPKNTKAFNHSMLSTDYIIGDTIKDSNLEYICISPLTIVNYPGTITQVPSYIGSIYWLAINKENEIYLQTFGTDLCKFYGKVWNHEIEMVVPFKTTDAVTAKNIQMKALGPNWNSIYTSTDDQSSQDVNISKTNRNYRWIDKSWYSALPLPKNGRLTDYYVKIKFVYNNYVTNPTISKNIQKISQFLKTFFEVRK